MEGGSVLQSVFALLFVLALIMLASHLLRRYGVDKLNMATRKQGGKTGRLQVVEALMIDGRRKLVLIKRDEVEHLLLLTPTSETVVETGIVQGKHSLSEISANTWKVEG